MLRIIIIFIALNLYNPALTSITEDIISKMKITNNLSFNFIQTINNKNENGKCIIEYPKKIWCLYNDSNKKMIVSNGKSLAIKTKNKGSYHLYPLSKTPLVFLLDKEYLISKMKILKPREVDNQYLNFTFLENDNLINVFFDKKSLYLVGWQTQDVYQNLVVTFISSIKKNKKINKKIFILPKNN